MKLAFNQAACAPLCSVLGFPPQSTSKLWQLAPAIPPAGRAATLDVTRANGHPRKAGQGLNMLIYGIFAAGQSVGL